MDATLIEQIKKSGLKKNHIAKTLNIVPNHFYQCLSGTRNLSHKKEQALRTLLLSLVN